MADLHDIATELGCQTRYMQSPHEVLAEIQSQLPAGVMVGRTYPGGTDIPEGAVKVGTVKVRHADPAMKFYIYQRGPGRPEVGPESGIQDSDDLADWLSMGSDSRDYLGEYERQREPEPDPIEWQYIDQAERMGRAMRATMGGVL
jgi:hypothetical protein